MGISLLQLPTAHIFSANLFKEADLELYCAGAELISASQRDTVTIKVQQALLYSLTASVLFGSAYLSMETSKVTISLYVIASRDHSLFVDPHAPEREQGDQDAQK
jgi:hypothetical protein